MDFVALGDDRDLIDPVADTVMLLIDLDAGEDIPFDDALMALTLT